MTGMQAAQALDQHSLEAVIGGAVTYFDGDPVVFTKAGKQVSLRKGMSLIVRSVKWGSDGYLRVELISIDRMQQIAAELLAD
jgi:hypothetical protein